MRNLFNAMLLLAGLLSPALGGDNFTANGRGVRAEYLKAAEEARINISVFWTGRPLRGDWYRPCPITVVSEGNDVGAGGSTTMTFDRGEVFNWNMRVQGSRTMIRDSVIPHEVHHTVIASHARRGVERWLDEGMATLFETPQEQARIRRQAARYMDHDHCVFRHFDDQRYPQGSENVMALYSTGFTFVEWLVEQKGTSTLWQFATDRRKASEKFQRFYGMSVSTAWGRWRTWQRDRDAASPTPMQRWYANYTPPDQTVDDSGKPTLYVFKTKRFFCLGCYNFSNAYQYNSEFRQALQSRYFIVEKDVDTDAELARRFNVQSIPAFCPTNSSRHVEGYSGASWLISMLDGLPKDRSAESPQRERAPPQTTQPQTTPQTTQPQTTPQTTPQIARGNEDWQTVPRSRQHTTGCRCAECFRRAFARIQALEARVAELERRLAGRDGRDGTNGQQGPPGTEGRGIVDVRMNDQGILQFAFSDKPNEWVNIGLVRGQDGTNGTNGSNGRGIANTRLTEDGILQFAYTDKPNEWVNVGLVRGTDGQDGKDGRGVVSARVKNGNLELRYYGSPDWVAVGPVQGPAGTPGRGVESVRITTNGQLEIKYTDGDNWFAVGHVRGATGAAGTNQDPRVTELTQRIVALEPLLRREVHLYVGGTLVDSLTGDEALKPGDPIPIYAIPRAKGTNGKK